MPKGEHGDDRVEDGKDQRVEPAGRPPEQMVKTVVERVEHVGLASCRGISQMLMDRQVKIPDLIGVNSPGPT